MLRSINAVVVVVIVDEALSATTSGVSSVVEDDIDGIVAIVIVIVVVVVVVVAAIFDAAVDAARLAAGELLVDELAELLLLLMLLLFARVRDIMFAMLLPFELIACAVDRTFSSGCLYGSSSAARLSTLSASSATACVNTSPNALRVTKLRVAMLSMPISATDSAVGT